MKIAFLDAATMGDVSFEPIAQLGEFITYAGSTAEEARERVKDLDVLLINKVLVDKQLIDSAPNLKLICIAATGVNNIDVEYAASKGIPVRKSVENIYKYLEFPKRMVFIATNDDTKQIVYMFYEDPDIDYISEPLDKHIKSDCGWKYISKRIGDK